jgi:hypothetical protein
MTAAEALESGLADAYVLPPVAAELIFHATEGADAETQTRARDALLRLDSELFAWCPRAGRLAAMFDGSRATAETDAFAEGVGLLVARAVRSASRDERQRIAPLLLGILREAGRLASEERQAAA